MLLEPVPGQYGLGPRVLFVELRVPAVALGEADEREGRADADVPVCPDGQHGAGGKQHLPGLDVDVHPGRAQLQCGVGREILRAPADVEEPVVAFGASLRVQGQCQPGADAQVFLSPVPGAKLEIVVLEVELGQEPARPEQCRKAQGWCRRRSAHRFPHGASCRRRCGRPAQRRPRPPRPSGCHA